MLAIQFLCVMSLGETGRAYGNFAFVHLFHGKAILATCMVPAIAGAALVYARHGGVRRWLLLLATQIALSTVLLLGAALLTRAISHAMSLDPGFAATAEIRTGDHVTVVLRPEAREAVERAFAEPGPARLDGDEGTTVVDGDI